MSKQGKRHKQRQPIEETVRLAISHFVDATGDVEVERHSYDWRPDDLVVWVRLHQAISGSILEFFKCQIAKRIHALLPQGQQLDDWLVVIECKGESLTSVASHDKLEEHDCQSLLS